MEVETTAIVKVNPQVDLAVTALYGEAVTLLTYAEAAIIKTDADVIERTNDLSIIAQLKKAIEEKRKEYVGPINEHLKAVNDAFKSFADPLVQADTITRKKVLDYRAEQNRVRQEQEEINRMRIEAAQREMKLTGELTESVNLVETQEQPEHYRTDSGTLGTMKVRKWEVVDFSLLPDRFKIENATLIGKVVRAGEQEIPGVRIWEEETLRVSAR